MAYKALILADTPILFLPLTETSGTTAADVSGYGSAGTYSSAPSAFFNPIVTSGTTPTKTQLFSGTRKVTGTLDLTVWSSSNRQQAFSIEAWVYAASISTPQLIFGRSTTDGLFIGQNFVTFSVVTTAGTETLSVPIRERNQTMQVTGVYAETSISILVNGVQKGVLALAGKLTNTSTAFQIGGTTGAGDSTYISHVSVYKKALSGIDATIHFGAGRNSTYFDQISRISGLYYVLDDAETDVALEYIETLSEDFDNYYSMTNMVWIDGLYQQYDPTVQGQRIVQYDIGELGVIDGSRIDWTYQSANLVIETSFDGTTWTACTNHSTIPGVTRGTDITDKVLWVRQTFNVASNADIPALESMYLIFYVNKNLTSAVNSAVATIVEPVTLAQSPDEPVVRDIADYCSVGTGGSITIPTDADAQNTYAFEVLVKKDTATGTFLTIGTATLAFDGTVSGMTVWINGVQKVPAASDFVAGVWTDVYIQLTTPANNTIVLGGGASYMYPAKYWAVLQPQTIINHYNSTFGTPILALTDGALGTIAEVGVDMYQYAWSQF